MKKKIKKMNENPDFEQNYHSKTSIAKFLIGNL